MPLWTAEQAREMGAKGANARWHSPKPEPPNFATVPPVANQDSEYVRGSLACVRAEIGKIDGMLLKCGDPQGLDRLASARAKLSEVERNLAGRPGAGQLRPAASRSIRPIVGAAVPEPDPPA